jgi:2-polyprenyl-6-methoxyphenol hydroxylase-like FAD-dependent oxidoreductase
MNAPVTIIGNQSALNHSVHDVLISGAGPVGLFLACELALAKCSVLILERAENPHSPLKRLPFGLRGLSAPSVEALYRRGLLNQLELNKRIKNPHQDSGRGARRQVGHFAGIPFHEGNIDTSQWRYRLPSSTDIGAQVLDWSRAQVAIMRPEPEARAKTQLSATL